MPRARHLTRLRAWRISSGDLSGAAHIYPTHLHTSPHLSTPLHTSPHLSTPLHTSPHLSTPLHTSPHLSTPLSLSLSLALSGHHISCPFASPDGDTFQAIAHEGLVAHQRILGIHSERFRRFSSPPASTPAFPEGQGFKESKQSVALDRSSSDLLARRSIKFSLIPSGE